MNDSSTQAKPISLFAGYRALGDSYDEMLDGSGETRPHWQTQRAALDRFDANELSVRWQRARRLLHENGIAYNSYGAEGASFRPWVLDPYPLPFAADDWDELATGLAQRARLLNRVIHDLLGEQKTIADGTLPQEVLFRHPHFHRALHGALPPHENYLDLYACDLARAPDGKWWVVKDRTESPSGLGFALENRIIVSQMFPALYQQSNVERLAPFFIKLRSMLSNKARRHQDNPRIVLLTQGRRDAHFFEDAYLTRYLGYTLAVGSDLAVRNNRVWLKTLGGLLPVDVILRRPSTTNMDALEMPGKPMGTAGIVQATRSGNVAIANGLGSGLVESPIFMAFMPQLCQSLLEEDLQIPGVATWWCGREDSLRYVLENLDELELFPAYRQRENGLTEIQRIAALPIDERRKLLQANPSEFVAQEKINRSTAPTWSPIATKRCHVALRTFLVRSEDTYEALPGGLARMAADSNALDLLSLTGEGCKDVWVQADTPVEPITLLDTSAHAIELKRSGAELPSQVADNFFWLGRNMERIESAARVLRVALTHVLGESEWSSMELVRTMWRVLGDIGCIETGQDIDGIGDSYADLEYELPRLVLAPNANTSLRATILKMHQLGAMVRDRVSVDTWRIIHRINLDFQVPNDQTCDLSELQLKTDRLLGDIAAFYGCTADGMTRTLAWRFLELGRRIERGMRTTAFVHSCLADSPRIRNGLLESMLEIGDSLMTHRSRYLSKLRLDSVLDLLITDETNPRSVGFQLQAIMEHVDELPREETLPNHTEQQRLAMSLVHTIRMLDIRVLCDLYMAGEPVHLQRLLDSIETQLPELSQSITNRYLIHAGPTHQLAEILATPNS